MTVFFPMQLYLVHIYQSFVQLWILYYYLFKNSIYLLCVYLNFRFVLSAANTIVFVPPIFYVRELPVFKADECTNNKHWEDTIKKSNKHNICLKYIA